MEFITKPGHTVIGAQQAVESFLMLSEQSRKKDLLPVLYKSPGIRFNIEHFLQSLVVHEQLYFTTTEKHLEIMLKEARLETLSNLIKSLPPEILIEKVEKSPYVNEIGQIEQAYMRLLASPGFALTADLIDIFNYVFPVFSLTKEKQNRHPSKYHNMISRHLVHYDRLASIANDMAFSLFEKNPRKKGYQLYLDQVLSQIRIVAEKKIQYTNEWLGQNRFSIDAPLVFGYIVEKAKGKTDIIAVTLEVRNSKEATAFRKQCLLFDEALMVGDDKVLLDIANEIDDKIKQLSKRIGEPQINIDISFPLSIAIHPRDISEYIKTKRKRHLIFVSQLYESAITSRNIFDRFSQLL